MFDWIINIFNKVAIPKTNSEIGIKYLDDPSNYIWCLVGNIVNEHLNGSDIQIMYGSKHFSPHTKVYCFPIKWGDGYENIKVIGRHRHTNRNICIVIPSKLITNWRLQKVYRPYILNVMKSQYGWTNKETDKEDILEMLKWLPKEQ